jgi:hypothetical protein
MRFFIFKSDVNPDVRAFAREDGRPDLPAQFAPWNEIGVVRDDQAPPHNLDRAVIEKAIEAQGFQLFRSKKAATE